MTQHLALVAIVVADYDEAIAWYTEKLGFTLVDLDGETVGRLPLEVSVIPRSFRVGAIA